jgi:hypothetical protein
MRGSVRYCRFGTHHLGRLYSLFIPEQQPEAVFGNQNVVSGSQKARASAARIGTADWDRSRLKCFMGRSAINSLIGMDTTQDSCGQEKRGMLLSPRDFRLLATRPNGLQVTTISDVD